VAALSGALAAAGATVFPSDANYVLAHAPGVAARLRARGVTVRDCASFGLPDHVRVAAPRPADLPAVLDAVAGLGDV
jgi:histidinol-phosphate aminotransferase